MNSPLYKAEEILIICNDNIIKAIKMYRDMYGCDIIEAKKVITPIFYEKHPSMKDW